jgi:methylenetetrahydrofolate reductase (NADPH)
VLFRRHTRLTEPARATLAAILRAPTYELVPLRNAMDEAVTLPPGARVSVTASPAKGPDATIELCERLAALGFVPVPHLSARMTRDRTHLVDLLERLRAADIDRAFVVGGDAKEAGEYPDGLSLLRAMAESGLGPSEIGIPCYPQGHAFIADGPLAEALLDKAPFATYMTAQLCFDTAAIASFVAARRAEGLALPVFVGVPGVAEPHRLLAISARIGVADTQRFLTKNMRFVARLLRSGGFYRPDGLLEGIAPTIADPAMGVAGIHLYTFNATHRTEAWRRDFVARLVADRHPETVGAGRS